MEREIIMNKQEIFNGLWTITKERYDACKADVAPQDYNYAMARTVGIKGVNEAQTCSCGD